MGKKLVELKKLPPARVARSKIVAVMNNKGGVGKSSLSIAYGLHMFRTGHNVLFIDCDSQRNMTQRLGLSDDMNAIGKTKIERVGRLFREADIEGPKPDMTITVEYPNTMKVQGTARKGIIGIIAGDKNAVIEAESADRRLKNNTYLTLDRRDIFKYFRDEINKYRQFYDAIILDTAPALEGNLLNRLAVKTADEIICPIDGIEAALGLQQFIGWVDGETSLGSGVEHRPNITIAMVKYQKPTERSEKKLMEELGVSVSNEVYRAIASTFGPTYICEHGVQELSTLRKTVPGLAGKNQYTILSAELAEKLAIPRPSIFEYFTPVRAEDLKNKLSAVQKKTLVKTPRFKGAIYKDDVENQSEGDAVALG
jgi:cellulose biosynthesis protein BcsQ